MTAADEALERLRTALADHYEVERLLGQGGMGAVYLATDRTLQRQVAIKIVAAEVASSPVLRERFLQEARVVARLRHPGIVTVYSAGDAGGQLYFAMEFVQGESLRDLIQREGKVPATRAQEILRELALALDYAHQHGVIHRDVKPENVLIDQDTGRAMLTDFGVARALERDGSLTGTGVVLGSPRYMSPEQASGEHTVDGRADIYSLGLVGYEMIMGRPVVDGATAASMLVKHLTETPMPLAEAATGVPVAYSTAVDRALAKSPEQRWPSGRAMADALGGGFTFTPTPAPVAPRRTTRATRLAMIAGVVAAAIVGAFFAFRGGPSAPRQTFVVVPFEVQSGNSNVQWLREGAVNMLTLSLSQWTDLTVTDYERTLDFVQGEGVQDGRVSLESARRIARKANAGSLVMGQVSTTADSLVVTARLYEAGSGKLLNSDTRATGIEADPRATFDALARYLLDVSGGTSATTVDLARATTTSLQAYRDYLEGLRSLNRWDLGRADSLFASAIQHDSTFALAYHKRALTRGWSDVGGQLGPQHAQRAVELSGRLPPRERALVEGHNFLTHGLANAQGDTTGRRLLREAVRVYQSLVRTDSMSAEAWYGLGDALHHLSSTLNSNEGFAEMANGSSAAFRRTMAIDPDFHLAYSHLVDQYRSRAQRGNNFLLRGDSVVPVESVPVGQRDALRDSASARAISTAAAWLAADVSSAPPYRSLASSLRAAGKPDSAARVLRNGARISARSAVGGGVFLMEAALDEFNLGTPAVRGLVDSALTLVPKASLGRRSRPEQFTMLSLAVGLGAASGDSRLLARATDYWESGESPNIFTGMVVPELPPFVASVMRVAMGEEVTPELRRSMLERVRVLDRETGQLADARRNSFGPLAYVIFLATKDSAVGEMAQRWNFNNRMVELDAARALARGDTARARDLAREFPTVDSLRTTNFGMAGLRTVTRAEVLTQLGDLRAAVGNYEALDPTRFNTGSPNEPGYALYVRSFAARGRLYEQLGEPERALVAYEKYLSIWNVDDPVTARERGEIRAAVARLRDAPRRR